MKKIFSYPLAFLIALFSLAGIFSPHSAEAAVRTSTAIGGAWNVGSTWVGGVAPANADAVIIATTNGNSVTMSGNRATTGLTVNVGAILNFDGAYTLTQNGNLMINGSIIGSTGIIKMNVSGLAFDGGGSVGSSILVSQNFSFPATANLTINNNINSAGRTVTNNGVITLNGNYARTGGTAIWTQGVNAYLNISGAFTPSANVTLNASAAGNTINYYGAAQSIENATYLNLTLSGSGTKTFITGTTIVNGKLSMQGTATATMTGTLSPGAASTLEYKGSAAQVAEGEFISPWPGSGGVMIENAGGVTLSSAKSVGANPFTIGSVVAGSVFNDGGFQLTSTGTLNLVSGTFKLGSAGTATVFPSFGSRNISSGTTVEYASGAAQTVSSAPNYSNLTFSGNGAKTTAAGTVVVGADWSVNGGAAVLNTNNSNVTVTGNITGTGAITSGTGTITIGGNWTNSGTFTKDAGTVIYNGSSAQTVGALTYNNLTISKAGGSASLAGSGTRVDGVLSLSGGNIVTGVDDIYISSTGSVSRTSGHIVGNLRKYIPTGAASKTFEIGDASNYTLADLVFGNVTVAGDLTAKTTASDHPNIGSSDIEPTMTANRYWTFTNSVSSPVSFNNYNATFHFINPGDLDAGADPLGFSVGQYSGSVWSYPTLGTRTSSSAQASGMTAFGDFQLGARRNPVPTTTSINPTYKTVGDAQFTMTVNGTNFVNGVSAVRFNGSSRATTFVSSTQLTATILASDLTVATSSALITVFNSAPGGGVSNAQTFIVYNPTPTTSSISPDTKVVGEAQFTMTVNGSNFVIGATVKFAGSARATTYVSANQLTAVIPSSDLTTVGDYNITVANPAPVLAESNAQVFHVINQAPFTTSISPTYKTVGDAQFEMTVNGDNFITSSVVNFNGSPRATAYVSANQLTATIPASDLTVATSSALITVTNPAPGGGTSNAQVFTVNEATNPVPTTTSIDPSSKTVGDSQFEMAVNGTNFVSGATVKFAGSARATTYVSANQLTAVIPASDLTTVGDYNITVANPAPVLAESNAQVFHVINPAPFINSISPTYKTVGDPQFEMTVSGMNFVSNSTVNFNGSPRATTYVSAGEVTATILASDLTVATSSALITVSNPGGGTSNSKVFSVYNPTPVTTFISPSSKTVGDPQFEMTVNGTGFMNGATVKFNGSARSTSYVSATQLTATILDADLSAATTSALITVANPAPTLSDSNAQVFSVNPVGNPLPVVTSISPSSAVAGDPGFTLTVNGSNFISSSVVRFGGTDEPTTYVSPIRLTAEIPAADISSEGNYNVRVFNPLPGGGLSDPQLFTVTAVPPTVAVKFSITSADSGTVGSPVIVTVRALKSDNSIDTNFNNGVTLVSTGSATGAGLLNLVGGIATVGINDSVAETVQLSLSDTQGTGLDISSVKNVTFAAAPVSGPGGGPSVRPTTLTISGRAFPGATISLVEKKSGQASVTSQNVNISGKGDFTITVSGIIQGEYTYNLLVRDKEGRSSQTKTYNVNFVSESLFERDILVPPTISLAQSIIKKGDQLKVSGYAYPGTKVTLNLDDINYETVANASGIYEFSINTTLLSVGSHFARVNGTDTATRQETGWSTAQSFQISQTPALAADIDLDKNGIIDVRDWSIFLNRFGSRSADVIRTIDFNGDGRADAADLSIFLANYTASIR